LKYRFCGDTIVIGRSFVREDIGNGGLVMFAMRFERVMGSCKTRQMGGGRKLTAVVAVCVALLVMTTAAKADSATANSGTVVVNGETRWKIESTLTVSGSVSPASVPTANLEKQVNGQWEAWSGDSFSASVQVNGNTYEKLWTSTGTAALPAGTYRVRWFYQKGIPPVNHTLNATVQ
jgi:hypothetical protein